MREATGRTKAKRRARNTSDAPPAESRHESAKRRVKRRSLAPARGRYDRSQTPEQRRAEQRLRLIEAAAEVFASKGFAGTSVDLIVRRIRMSRRTFYEHFRDLEHAFLEVYDHASLTLFREVEKATAAESDPIGKLRAGISSYLSAMSTSAPLARVLYHQAGALGSTHIAHHEAMRHRYVAMWMQGFRDAYTGGWSRRVPEELTVYGLSAAIEAVALRYIDSGAEERILEAVPALMSLALGLVLPKEAALRTLLAQR